MVHSSEKETGKGKKHHADPGLETKCCEYKYSCVHTCAQHMAIDMNWTMLQPQRNYDRESFILLVLFFPPKFYVPLDCLSSTGNCVDSSVFKCLIAFVES